MLTLNFLGPIEILQDGRPAGSLGSARAVALLAYLATAEQRPHSREKLMTLLWPGMPQASAQQNLRQVLYLLRRKLEAGSDASLLLADRTTVRLDPAFLVEADVVRLVNLAGSAEPHDWQAAVDLYRGDFLAEFSLVDSESFEEWAGSQRAFLRRLALETMGRLARHELESGTTAAAESLAQKQLALDPYSETAQQQLLEALSRDGRRHEAINSFTAFRQRLATELDIEPSAVTADFYERILNGDFGRGNGERAGQVSGRLPDGNGATTLVLHNLPRNPEPIVGRDATLAELDHLIESRRHRLITILAPGGMGKTRLATTWAARQIDNKPQHFPDGVFKVDLVSRLEMGHLYEAIAGAIAPVRQGSASDRRPARQQVLEYLADRHALLVLDNFEHLLDDAETVDEILDEAPGVFVLVTSRESLQLGREQLLLLEGLHFPPEDSAEDMESFPAVQLFLHQTRHLVPGYQPATADLTHIGNIARHAAGMPLALELAASWMGALPPEELEAEMQRSLDILRADRRDLPDRHRSMRAAMTTGWENLEPADRQALAVLTLFPDGFTREAAQAVAGAGRPMIETLGTLARLRDKSLLAYDREADRYRIHELLRQFGREQLEDPAGAMERFALFYTRLLRDAEAGLKGAAEAQMLDLIEQDMGNIRAAWSWLIQQRRTPELLLTMESLTIYYELRGSVSAGQLLFGQLVNSWQDDDSEEVDDQRLLALGLAALATVTSGAEEAAGFTEQSLDISNALARAGHNTDREQARAYLIQADSWWQSRFDNSLVGYQEAQARYRRLEDDWGIVRSLNGMFMTKATRMYYDLANEEVFLVDVEECMTILPRLQNVRLTAVTYLALAMGSALAGDMERYREAVAEAERVLAEAPENDLPVMRWHRVWAAHYAGDVERSTAMLDEEIAERQVNGREYFYELMALGTFVLHLGAFDRVKPTMDAVMARHQAVGVGEQRLHFRHHILAMYHLTQDAFEEAREQLSEVIPYYESIEDQHDLGGALAFLGRVDLASGDKASAVRHLHQALQISFGVHNIYAIGEAVLGAAMLLAEEGDIVRARQIYETTFIHPLRRSSQFYRRVYGEPLERMTARLSTADKERIQASARSGDIWLQAAELIDTLQKM